MLPAFEAILGHRSAHSFATGPVIAEPTKKKQSVNSLENSLVKNNVVNPQECGAIDLSQLL